MRRSSLTPRLPATCARPPTMRAGAAERKGAPARPPRGGPRSVVLAHAAVDDAILLDLHLYGAVAGPVFGVYWVVLDGGVQPQAGPLLSLVVGALDRPGLRL